MGNRAKSSTTSRSRKAARGKAVAPTTASTTTRHPRSAATRTSQPSDKAVRTTRVSDSVIDSTDGAENDPDNASDWESDSGPEPDPGTSSNVSKPDELEKLQKRALDACKQLTDAIAGRHRVGKKGMSALETIQRFLAKQEQAMGFSSVQMQHLKELGVRDGKIVLNYEKLREASRSFSDRFSKDDEYLDLSGLSHKERLAEFIGLNYFLESMFYPGGKDLPRDRNERVKMSPEFKFDDAIISKGETRKKFGGFIDLVTFIVDTKFKWKEQDVRTIKQLFRHPGVYEGTLVTTEFKSPAMAFLESHVAEGVSQAMASCAHSGRPFQRFILTDGKRWRFCIYDDLVNAYYSSDILADTGEEDKKVILTLLDEWIWESAAFSSSANLWTLETPKPL